MLQTINTKQGVLFFILVISCKLLFAATTPVIIPEVNFNPNQLNKKKQNNPPQLTSIHRAMIETSPATTLAGLLKQQQSVVRLTSNSGDTSQVAMSIRGFGDNAAANSLILMDGFPLTNPSLLAPSLNSIALTDIERIDIFPGSQGTLWGDQAVGGVVNIITRHPEKVMAEVNAGVGSFNRQFLSLYAADKFREQFFVKAAGFSDDTNHYRQHNHQLEKNLMLQVGMDGERGSTDFYAQKFENAVDLPGGLTAAQYAANPEQATNVTNALHFTTEDYRLHNRQEINSNWVVETRLFHHDTHGHGFLNYVFRRNDETDNLSPRLIGRFHQQKMTLGVEGELSHYDFYSTRVQNRASTRQKDIFLEDTITLPKNIDVKLGGRFAIQDNHIEEVIGMPVNSADRVFVTEQEIAFHPDDQWKYFLRRDGNFRFAKANEQTWLPDGVTSLRPQTGVSYESGLQRQTEWQRTQFSVYRLQLENEIAFDPVGAVDSPIGTFNNFPRTVRRGAMLSENIFATKKLTLNGQMNVVDARFTAGAYSGNVIPAVPVWNGNVGLDYAFVTHWSLNYTALYNGAAYASQDVQNAGAKIAGYWLNNIALQYTLKNYHVNFEVLNVLDHHYSVYTLFNPTNLTETYYPGAGRSFLLSFKLNIE